MTQTRTRIRTRTPGQQARTQGPPRRQPPGAVTLTGRGAVVALFAACLLGLLAAASTGWSAIADVMFVTTCGLVACYTRISGLRWPVVCPPLAFFGGTVLAQILTAPDTFSAAEGILVTLGSSAPWLFAGTGLTAAIALRRGYRPEMPWLSHLCATLRDVLPSWPGRGRRGRRGRRR